MLASGATMGINAKLVRWTQENQNRYELSQAVRYESSGNAALASQIQQGWKTYNFEVQDLHTYVAGGVRVHNQSAPTLAANADQFEAEFGHSFGGSVTDVSLLAAAIDSGNIQSKVDYVDGNDRYKGPFFTESGDKIVISMDSTTWFASMVKNGEVGRVI